jgi:hypothetical protein
MTRTNYLFIQLLVVATITGATSSASPTLLLSPVSSALTPTQVPRCHAKQLSVSFQGGEPGAGQRYATLVLTNHSMKACYVKGYVGMQLLNDKYHPLPTEVVRLKTKPPQSVVIRQNQSASSVLHWTVVSGSGEPTDRQCEPTPSYVRVTPPDERDFLLTKWLGDFVCVHGRIHTTPLVFGISPR